MKQRYRKAGDVAGQLAIAAVIIAGLVGSAAIALSFLLAAWMVTS